MCARRKGGRLRLAIDYRALNAKSLSCSQHPIPRIDDLLDRLGEATFFTTLDLKSGYHQMPVREGDRELTSFVVPWGQYQWRRGCPFGLSGAPSSFQRLMSVVLGDSQYTEALCYLDDILVWGRSWKEHLTRLERVLGRIRAAGMLLSPEKCVFGTRRVEYLGHVIEGGCVRIHEDRVKQLRNLPLPRDVHELRRALGAFAYVQRWLPGMAEIAKPLYMALEKDGKKKLIWDTLTTTAFETLKQQVADAVALNLPNFDRKFVLVTDASETGVGAMLANRDKNNDETKLKPVAFFHHALSPEQSRYSTTERELLSVVLAVRKFRVYLGRPFDLITDHRALCWLNTLDANDQKGRRGRWIELLQQYDINPIHKAGKSPELSMADYLSRVGVDGRLVASIQLDAESLEIDPPVSAIIKPDNVALEQGIDPAIGPVVRALRGRVGLEPMAEESAKRLYSLRNRLKLGSDGLLRYVNYRGHTTQAHPLGVKEEHLVVLPRSLRRQLLHVVHDAPLSGHMGRDRTWERARHVVWWPGMKADIATYVAGCDQCQQHKQSKRPGRAPMQLTDIPERPLDKVQIDFCGPFQPSVPEGHQYVLAMQDVFTRFTLLIATKDCTAETAASLFRDRWVCVFGMPLAVQSDNGTHFTSIVFEQTCRDLGITHLLGSPAHARSQGQVERQNQLIDNVRCVAGSNPASWPQALVAVQFAHNSAKNATTGHSPLSLLLDQSPRCPEMLISRALAESESGEDVPPSANRRNQIGLRVSANLGRLNGVYTKVRARIEGAQKTCVARWPPRGSPFEVGQHVRRRLQPSERRKLGKKLSPRQSERYVVVERRGVTYYIRPADDESASVIRRHYDDLEAAPSQTLRWEASHLDSDSDPSHATSDRPEQPAARRYPRRNRQPTRRLQLDGASQRYGESAAWGSDNSLSDSLSD